MIFSIVGLSLIAVSICVILKKTNPEFSLAVSLIASIIILTLIFANFSPIFNTINRCISTFNLNNIYITTILKALGICYITQIASETCKDSGFSSISSKLELAGKISIVLLSLPMFESLIKTLESLIYLKWN